MTNTLHHSLLLLMVLTMAFACNRKANKNNKEGEQESTTTIKITDVHGDWVVRSLTLTGQEEMRPDKYYFLSIDSESMGLPLDVNQCGTNYKAKEDSLHIDDFMTCTEACCDAKEGTAVARFLSGPMHYQIKEEVLYLSNKKGTLQLFQPATSLVNSSWTAVSYRAKNDDQSYKFSNPYTLVFEPMNAILELDANNCTGPVNFSKNAFEFPRPMGCSRKCCDSKDGILLKDMLQGKNTFTTKGQGMTVTTTDHIIEFVLDDSSLED